MDTFKNLLTICALLNEKKAEDILVCDATKMTNVADYFIIVSSTSSTHTKGIADFLESEVLKINGFNYVNREGFNMSDWVVLEFNNIFVHILTKQRREYYSLEKLFDSNNIKTYDKLKKEYEKQVKELEQTKQKTEKVKLKKEQQKNKKEQKTPSKLRENIKNKVFKKKNKTK